MKDWLKEATAIFTATIVLAIAIAGVLYIPGFVFWCLFIR